MVFPNDTSEISITQGIALGENPNADPNTAAVKGAITTGQDEQDFTLNVQYSEGQPPYNNSFQGFVATDLPGGAISFHLVVGSQSTYFSDLNGTLSDINAIWHQACIGFGLSGFDTVNAPNGQTGGFTNDQLMKIANKNNNPDINIYFVQSFNVSLANILAFRERELIKGAYTIFIADSIGNLKADAITIAHELGHILTLLDIRSDANNLMYAARESEDGTGRGTDLTYDQAKTARSVLK